MIRTVTQSHTHTTVTLPGINPNPEIPSIRTIIITGLVMDTPKAEIKRRVESLYPTSAAAVKFEKHRAWYASRIRKEGSPEQKQAVKIWAASKEEPQQGCAMALVAE